MALFALPALYLVLTRQWCLVSDALSTLLCVSGYAMLVVVDLLNGAPASALKGTAINYLPILAIPFVATGVSNLRISSKDIDFGFKLAAYVAIATGSFNYLTALDSAEETVSRGINLNQIPYGFICGALSGRFLAVSIKGVGFRLAHDLTIAVALFVVVALTFSKLAWASSLTIIFCVLALNVSIRFLPLLAIGFVATTAAFLALFAIFVPAAWVEVTNFADALRTLSQTGSSDDGSVGSRLLLWQLGLTVFTENPILGVGLNAVSAEALAVAQDTAADRTALVGTFSHLHNDIIVHLAAFGVFGAIFVLGFFLLIWRTARETSLEGHQVFLWSLIPGTLVYMSADVVFNMDAITAAFALILGTSMSSRRRS
ncbi:O-antigen ligase family protein [Anianabacter salinae]|uniref:O-antigen ligase family protein n=1 Tax=Anianabacter salinae TaxID=2851023 RepID=UPI00225E2739|nr:O-antigen ligase family protein [Anianabacter salinae]MBV0914185.1 O-antigen ligase family protein [Anianabacter salinae]